MLIETLNNIKNRRYTFVKTKICNPSPNSILIFLWCFFGSKVEIWNMIMLIQILSELETTVHLRLSIHSMICHSANFSVRNWLNEQSRKIKFRRKILGFQRKILRKTTCKTSNIFSFKQFGSTLKGFFFFFFLLRNRKIYISILTNIKAKGIFTCAKKNN